MLTAKKKMLKRTVSVILSLLLLGILIFPVCAAENTPKDYDEALNNIKSPFGKTVFVIVATAEGVNPNFNFSDIAGEMLRLTQNTKDRSTGENLLQNAIISWGENVFKSFEVIGIILMMLYFFLSLLDKMQADQISTEIFFKKLIMLAICVYVTMHGTDIFSGIIRVGDALLTDSPALSNSGLPSWSSELKDVYTLCCKNSILSKVELVGVVLLYITPYVGQLLCCIIVYILSISRLVEVIVRYAFAPIALAPIAGEGLHSSGVRYIKKFASVCIQGIIYVFVIRISGGIATSMGSNTAMKILNDVVGAVIIPLITIGVLLKVPKWADDIMGV